MIRRGMLATIEAHAVDDAFVRSSFKPTVKRLPQVLTPAQQAERVQHLTTTQAADEARYAASLRAHAKNGGDFQRLDTLATLMNGAANDGEKPLKSFHTVGLHIIAALTQQNGQDIGELAQTLNRHPAVISAAVKRLARDRIQEMTIRPLVRVVQFGPSKRVFLYCTWEDRLAAIRSKMCTDGLLKARQRGYANQRIRRIDKILPQVRNPELRELYQEIRARTERMIAAIEGRHTAKEAAALIHQEIAQERKLATPPPFENAPRVAVQERNVSHSKTDMATRPLSAPMEQPAPVLAPPAPSYAPAVGDVLTQHAKRICVTRLADGKVYFEVYDLGVNQGDFWLNQPDFVAQVVGSRPRLERQGVRL